MTAELKSLTDTDRRLLTRVLPWIRQVVRNVAFKWRPTASDLEEVTSRAIARAAEMMSGFDPSRGHEIEAYLYMGVRGSAIEELVRLRYGLSPNVRRLYAADAKHDVRAEEEPLDAPEPEKSDRDQLSGFVRARAIAMLAQTCLSKPDDDPVDDQVADRAAYLKAVRALQGAREALEPREKAMLRGLYEEDKTVDEVAAELKVTDRTIRRMHNRARERLARALEKEGVFEAPPVLDI